jgi:hypothetical protein
MSFYIKSKIIAKKQQNKNSPSEIIMLPAGVSFDVISSLELSLLF